jgi:hypothetical protein
VLAGVLVTACDVLAPDDGGRVTVRFATTSNSSQSADIGITAAAAQELVLTGTNGTLTISNISFIVSEFELEREDDACEHEELRDHDDDEDDDEEEDDDCEEFEIGPFFVELPLSGAVSVVSQEVPAGTYSELEFEVENLHRDHDDDDDEEEHRKERNIPSLISEIRSAGFAQWPEAASMVVVGTFTPRTGAARPFTVFFDAEIEIKLDFEPPLLVEDGERLVDIEIDPSFWFRTFANTVTDLSAFDFATTHRVVDFEAKLKSGFQRVEFDD